MSVWSILEVVTECCAWLDQWRLLLCILLGAGCAFLAYTQIGVDPWRWIAAGALVLASIRVGWRWEHGR